MNSKDIECVFYCIVFLFLHLCCCYYWSSECVRHNIVECNFDIMDSKCIEYVIVILFTLLFCFLHLCSCDYLSSKCVV